VSRAATAVRARVAFTGPASELPLALQPVTEGRDALRTAPAQPPRRAVVADGARLSDCRTGRGPAGAMRSWPYGGIVKLQAGGVG
jgi:hypothetical protein